MEIALMETLSEAGSASGRLSVWVTVEGSEMEITLTASSEIGVGSLSACSRVWCVDPQSRHLPRLTVA